MLWEDNDPPFCRPVAVYFLVVLRIYPVYKISGHTIDLPSKHKTKVFSRSFLNVWKSHYFELWRPPRIRTSVNVGKEGLKTVIMNKVMSPWPPDSIVNPYVDILVMSLSRCQIDLMFEYSNLPDNLTVTLHQKYNIFFTILHCLDIDFTRRQCL